jgi:hypothetical protein
LAAFAAGTPESVGPAQLLKIRDARRIVWKLRSELLQRARVIRPSDRHRHSEPLPVVATAFKWIPHFQNNHHKFAMSPNFAARWFEIDPTYYVMRVLHALRIIDMRGAQTMRYEGGLSRA